MPRFFGPVAVFLVVLVPLAALAPAALPQPPQDRYKEKAKAQPKPPPVPDGTQVSRDLRYGPHEERNVLDLYVPKSDAPLPLVIWVHGGGWQGGSKDAGNPAMRFLTQGYAVA